jgi:hypothetical protein
MNRACLYFLALFVVTAGWCFLLGGSYELLGELESSHLFGGDEYDLYALCDGVNSCVQCVPRTCTTSVLSCIEMVPGNDGCVNDDGTDSYCMSYTLWSDCEHKGGVQVCGGPSNRRPCTDMGMPFCSGWEVNGNPAGCVPGALSVLECQNCATIP